jgi:hypothetical protein
MILLEGLATVSTFKLREVVMASIPPLTLNDETKDRIRLEEQYRVEIRAEQEKLLKERKKPFSIKEFLGTTLGIAILTSIMVPALGGLYSHTQQKASQRAATNKQVVRLTSEFDWRLAEIEYHRGKIPNVPDSAKWASAAYIWYAIVGRPEFAPTEPSFKGVHLAGIVSQLKSLGYPDPNGIAFKTIKDMESGGAAVHLEGQPVNADHTYDVAVLDRQLAILQDFRSRVAPKTGFWDLLW